MTSNYLGVRARPCSEWWERSECVISCRPGRAPICELAGECLYGADRATLSAEFLEVFDAWRNNRLCLLAYRPETMLDAR